MIVIALDRDGTVSVGEPGGPVPLALVRRLARHSGLSVWAIGNQALVREGRIPGISDLCQRLGLPASSAFLTAAEMTALRRGARPGKGVDPSVLNVLRKRRRLRLLSALYVRTASRRIVVDDLDLSGVAGWEYLPPAGFVKAAAAILDEAVAGNGASEIGAR